MDRTVNIVSTGTLIAPASAQDVVEKLCTRFEIANMQATGMLKQGAVIKKAIPQSKASKIIALFADLGLEVEVVDPNLSEGGSSETQASQGQAPQANAEPKVASKAPVNKRVRTPSPSPSAPKVNAKRKSGSIQRVDGGLSDFILCLKGLAIGCLVMGLLLLPLLVSLGLIILLGWSVMTIGSMGVIGMALAACLALIPLFLVIVTIVGSLVWWGRYPGMQAFPLDREQEPAVYNLVDEVCERLYQPKVEVIFVNHAPAIAEHDPGEVSVFGSSDNALYAGLPLLAMINVKDCVSLLCYALAPRNRKSVARLHRCLQLLRLRMTQVIHQRNQFDKRVEEVLQTQHQWWAIVAGLFASEVFALARALTRRLQTLIAYLIQPLERSMNYRSARFAEVVVGEVAFSKYAKILQSLQGLNAEVLEIQTKLARHRRLEANRTELFIALLKRVIQRPPLLQADKPVHWYGFGKMNPKWTRLSVFADAPQLLSDKPVRRIFDDFTDVCEQATLDAYRHPYIEVADKPVRDEVFYGAVPENFTTDLKQIKQLLEGEEKHATIIDRYLGTWRKDRFMYLDEPVNPELLRMDLQEVNDWLRLRLEDYRKWIKRYGLIREELYVRHLSHVMYHSGVNIMKTQHKELNINFEDQEVRMVGEQGSLAASKLVEERREEISTALRFIEQMFFQRIATSVYIMDSEYKVQAQQLLTNLQDLEDIQVPLNKLRIAKRAIEDMYQVKPQFYLAKLMPAVHEQANECSSQILKIFDRAQEITIGNLIEEDTLSHMLDINRELKALKERSLSPMRVVQVANNIIDVVEYQNSFALARLVELCARTEKHAGYKPVRLAVKIG